MKLKLKNIGKITSAEVEIAGITVIAGPNSTGKSTISKSLFCECFNSLHNLSQKSEKKSKRSQSDSCFLITLMNILKNLY